MKYIKPIWYFHLKPFELRNLVWFDYDQLSKEEKKVITYDNKYSNREISNWDASYQALMRGKIKQAKNNTQAEVVKLIPTDIYRFIRKYYKNIWLYFTLIQRLFTLSNPINEIKGIWQTRNVKKIDLFKTFYEYDKYLDFDSSLLSTNPFISIIIPTFNRYESLRKILIDLQNQSHNNFEVIVIDQSNPFKREFYNNFNLRFNIIRQEKPALWKARNSGIKSAGSELLLFLDDDSSIEPNWVSEHIKCIDYFCADISSGVSLSVVGDKIPENYSYFRFADQLDTGNVLIKRAVFEKCGLFDEQFEKMRMGDGEFGVRAYLNGFKSISNPNASRMHFKHFDGGLRELGTWDAFRSTKIFQPKPAPSVLYYWRKYWGNEAALISSIMILPTSFSPYKKKGKNLGKLSSFIFFLVCLPFVYILYFLAWNKSSIMLTEGAIIDRLTVKNIKT
ncbi:MAG: glycosyltransferase family 2 protein [Candidatus Marinimicrobia bacterium]|nr:glycosyltransferase family 2 protein [Candidatus Neomarinimicrobiota bacterium]